MELRDYLKDKYDTSELLERISEVIDIDTAIDIIEDFMLFPIFEQELQEANDQLSLF